MSYVIFACVTVVIQSYSRENQSSCCCDIFVFDHLGKAAALREDVEDSEQRLRDAEGKHRQEIAKLKKELAKVGYQ